MPTDVLDDLLKDLDLYEKQPMPQSTSKISTTSIGPLDHVAAGQKSHDHSSEEMTEAVVSENLSVSSTVTTSLIQININYVCLVTVLLIL